MTQQAIDARGSYAPNISLCLSALSRDGCIFTSRNPPMATQKSSSSCLVESQFRGYATGRCPLSPPLDFPYGSIRMRLYLFLNWGFLFSENALGPSMESSMPMRFCSRALEKAAPSIGDM